MSESHRNPFLRLVVNEDKARARAAVANWLLRTAPDPAPDDPEILAGLDGFPGGLERKDLREVIEDLVSHGELEKVQIGARQYLTRRTRPTIERDDDRELFRLEIALDLDREKQLLFKIAIVLELIVIALILRQWVLDTRFFLFPF